MYWYIITNVQQECKGNSGENMNCRMRAIPQRSRSIGEDSGTCTTPRRAYTALLMATSPTALKDLYELFASVDSTKEAEKLLHDMLTRQELDAVAERWQLIQALASGMTQREAAKKCKVSISKITRGAHELQYGTGGFLHFLKKLKKKVKRYG